MKWGRHQGAALTMRPPQRYKGKAENRPRLPPSQSNLVPVPTPKGRTFYLFQTFVGPTPD